MARAARRSGGSSSRKGRSSRARSAQLEQLNLHAAGIDVGADAHWVAVPKDRDEQPVRCFGAFTADLYALAEWLRQCQIETVVMESTGVYWIALFEVLEERGFDVKLVDAHDARQVPGRKTDVKDSPWLPELHTYGLLCGAFRPADQICVLRSYLRQRSMLVAMASRAVQHMQKVLEQMNLKLTEVVSDINGKTGMEIIHAILAGERDPQRLASHRDRRCKHDQATIAKALETPYAPDGARRRRGTGVLVGCMCLSFHVLHSFHRRLATSSSWEGHWRAEHVFALQQALEQYEFLQTGETVTCWT